MQTMQYQDGVFVYSRRARYIHVSSFHKFDRKGDSRKSDEPQNMSPNYLQGSGQFIHREEHSRGHDLHIILAVKVIVSIQAARGF